MLRQRPALEVLRNCIRGIASHVMGETERLKQRKVDLVTRGI